MPSQIISHGASFSGSGWALNDRLIVQEELQAEDVYSADLRHSENARIDQAAISPYWPGGGRMFGESQPLLVAPVDFSPRAIFTGSMNALGFSGITRDGNNTPVGGMTVRLFRTSDSTLVATAVSRYDGSYNVSTPYAGQDHFIVCHKAGSPEIAGASQSTLEPW